MKKYLITGLLVWVPLGITLWVLNLTIGTMDQTLLLLPAEWQPDRVLGIHIPGLGIILTFVVVLLSGNGNSFRKVLLVRYPHPQAWSLAFQTNVPGEAVGHFEQEHVAVFIPTTPSPVNGFYFFVPKADTIELDMTVDGALRTIVSMGVVADFEAVRQRAISQNS